MANENLVVVRAGDHSLHQSWTKNAPKDWDLIVSYFGSQQSPYQKNDEVSLFVRDDGTKWDSIFRLLTDNPALLEKYEYIWFPDDDVDIDYSGISNLFKITAEYDLLMSQPAVLKDSHKTWQLLWHCPSFKLRYSSFIEVMAPCIKTTHLKEIMYLFKYSGSGLGLDVVWCLMTEYPYQRAAVIDATPMAHTRPSRKGSLDNDLLKRRGVTREQEMHLVMSFFEVSTAQKFIIYGGVRSDGKALRANFWFFRRMAKDMLGDIWFFHFRKRTRKLIWHHLKYAIKSFQIIKIPKSDSHPEL